MEAYNVLETGVLQISFVQRVPDVQEEWIACLEDVLTNAKTNQIVSETRTVFKVVVFPKIQTVPEELNAFISKVVTKEPVGTDANMTENANLICFAVMDFVLMGQFVKIPKTVIEANMSYVSVEIVKNRNQISFVQLTNVAPKDWYV